MQPTHNPLGSAPAEPTPAGVEAIEPQIIAVWADDDDPAHAELFTPNGYADWHEANNLSGAFPRPAHFYAPTGDGYLSVLVHVVDTSDYDESDYAVVTHVWKRWSNNHDLRTIHATGWARRDGRA
jgi:hypothetical protein